MGCVWASDVVFDKLPPNRDRHLPNKSHLWKTQNMNLVPQVWMILTSVIMLGPYWMRRALASAVVRPGLSACITWSGFKSVQEGHHQEPRVVREDAYEMRDSMKVWVSPEWHVPHPSSSHRGSLQTCVGTSPNMKRMKRRNVRVRIYSTQNTEEEEHRQETYHVGLDGFPKLDVRGSRASTYFNSPGQSSRMWKREWEIFSVVCLSISSPPYRNVSAHDERSYSPSLRDGRPVPGEPGMSEVVSGSESTFGAIFQWILTRFMLIVRPGSALVLNQFSWVMSHSPVMDVATRQRERQYGLNLCLRRAQEPYTL